MRLGDMQAKPHQRITKYPLLLKAVLQSSQNPHVQQTLRGMVRPCDTGNDPAHRFELPPPPTPDFLRRCPDPLQLSSVNSFLESINDYLKLKDEEFALSISAQRVDGYEVEGINEEIDKVTRFSFSSCACWCSSYTCHLTAERSRVQIPSRPEHFQLEVSMFFL